MENIKRPGLNTAICLVLFTILCNGYAKAEQQNTKKLVVIEYFLKKVHYILVDMVRIYLFIWMIMQVVGVGVLLIWEVLLIEVMNGFF